MGPTLRVDGRVQNEGTEKNAGKFNNKQGNLTTNKEKRYTFTKVLFSWEEMQVCAEK